MMGATSTGVAIVHDRRASAAVIDDEVIELNIYNAIQNDPKSKWSHVSITSYNYAVLLTGEVPDPAVRARIDGIARATERVRKVHNQLIIGPPSSTQVRLYDMSLTAKVKASFFQIDHLSDFDPTRVKVVTDKGVVYLFGLVSHREAEAVSLQARSREGVLQVVKLFEYTD